MVKEFNQALLTAAKESIPRGARKNYKPYWTEELQELDDAVQKARDFVEVSPSTEHNIALKKQLQDTRRHASKVHGGNGLRKQRASTSTGMAASHGNSPWPLTMKNRRDRPRYSRTTNFTKKELKEALSMLKLEKWTR
jgi:hypothetical protein